MSSDDDDSLFFAPKAWNADSIDWLSRAQRGTAGTCRKLTGVSLLCIGVVAVLAGSIGSYLGTRAGHAAMGEAESAETRSEDIRGNPDDGGLGMLRPTFEDDRIGSGCGASGRCGSGDPSFSCQCDFLCLNRGDCCGDWFASCSSDHLMNGGDGGFGVGFSAYEDPEDGDVWASAEPDMQVKRHGFLDIDVNATIANATDEHQSLVDHCVLAEGGFCPPHSQRCRACDCCHWHTSCNRCPNGYEPDFQKCSSFPRARCKQNASPESFGTVSEIYTFGAPATTKEPLENLQREDRCFPGLRVYTEDRRPANLQVDAASIFTNYKHAQTNVLALHWKKPSYFRPCPEDKKPHWPQTGAAVYANWGLHHEPHYGPRLECVSVDHYKQKLEPFAKVHPFARLAYSIYGKDDDYLKPVMDMYLPGWRVVADETTKTKGDEDRVLLVQEQEEQSWACALVFEGTNNIGEFSTSINQHRTGYCGFTGVHAGYRNEIWTITRDLWPRLRGRFAKCSSLAVVGHSLGGAIAELFAACANSNRTSDPDYRLLQWIKGTPGRMEPIHYQHVARSVSRRRQPTSCR